jgi:hypothetical protein
MNAVATFPQQVQAEAKSTSDLLYERLENLRSLLRKSENELSAVRGECEVTFVQYLRSIFNPEASCRLTVVRAR